MSDDGKTDRGKSVVRKGSKAKRRASNTDTHFTVMGVTNALGQPVLCVIIIQATHLTALEKQGKEIQALVTCSLSGGITPTILTSMLRRIDESYEFKRTSSSPKPTLLIDGHSSRFSTEFLRYINSEKTKWVVTIGLPNATHLWQVADSTAGIARHEIIPIVNRAWKASFANVENSKKAVVRRGWGPLNYALLDHPDVNSCMEEILDGTCDMMNRACPVEELNTSSGYSASVTRDLITDMVRSDKNSNLYKEVEDDFKNNTRFEERMNAMKSITAGQLFGCGRTELCNEVLEMIERHAIRKEEESFMKLVRACNDFTKINKDVLTVARERKRIHLAGYRSKLIKKEKMG